MRRIVSEGVRIVSRRGAGLGKSAVIMPCALIVSLALGLGGLGIVFHAREALRASAADIGWLVGLWFLAYVVGCLALRPALGRLLPRTLIVGSCVAMAALTAGMLCAATLPALFALQALHALAAGLFWPPLMGWLSADAEGGALGRAISRFNLSWSVGSILSPLACGWLSARATPLPLQASAVLLAMAAAYVVGAVALLPRVRAESRVLPGLDQQGPAGRSTPLRFPAWVGLFVSYFGITVLRSVFPVAGLEVLHMAKGAIGALLLLNSLCSTAAFLVLGATRFWHFRSAPMLAAQVLGVAAFAALIASPPPWALALLFGALGLSEGFSYTESIFHGVSGSPHRARRMAIHEAVLASGSLVGPVIGGIVFERCALAGLWTLCAAVLLGGTAIQAALGLRLAGGRRGRKEEDGDL
jgi:DHA1 family multidrug resistance protein-like MFS transporter/DHA1 family quinolone resistance protein-like MFS transporter